MTLDAAIQTQEIARMALSEHQAWQNAFLEGQDASFDGATFLVNHPTVVVGAGFGNEHTGDINVDTVQTVDPGQKGLFIGIALPIVMEGIGVDNTIHGDTNVVSEQHVDGTGSDASIPFIGKLGIAIDVSVTLAGIGYGQHVDGDVGPIIDQHL
jgi:hypothetical protein